MKYKQKAEELQKRVDYLEALLKVRTEQPDEEELMKLSDLPEHEQKFCFRDTPHKFSHDYEQWAVDAKGLPVVSTVGSLTIDKSPQRKR